ncbi:hypothetical protein HDU93_001158, partial [Gonapodya sp. JEL0774]
QLRSVGIKSGPLFPRINGNTVQRGTEQEYDEILDRMRLALQAIGEPDVALFGSHSMRRGGVKYLINLCVDLNYIADLGDWGTGSPAFLRYIVTNCNLAQQRAGREAMAKVRS